jgi:hypothetical protein
VRIEVVEIAGQLTLEELAGIPAAYGKDAFMRQNAEISCVGHDQSSSESGWAS